MGQDAGRALVGGVVKVIRVWNAATGICTTDIPARSGSCIASLTSDQVAGNIFAASFGDDAIRLFDQRLKPSVAMVKCWRNRKQWITNIHMQRGGMRELVSGSWNGEIRLWDIRMDAPVESIQALNTHAGAHAHASNKADGGKGGDTLHEHTPVFAVGGDHHSVKTFNVNGNFLGALSRKARS
ncbi:uncharacterized protein K441DRAFT_683236 [Cenococcum geophilum 1.58]|uniref:Uncharacterized protein n=1 Tax=Cenococcum geophilum 1.58 TaxID=794803 RepID=A0ACC8EK35_9PEZI|nr:hypothetical protein K441DRAFT_683236 [Cenococcum geophilum 1.58]